MGGVDSSNVVILRNRSARGQRNWRVEYITGTIGIWIAESYLVYKKICENEGVTPRIKSQTLFQRELIDEMLQDLPLWTNERSEIVTIFSYYFFKLCQ